MPNYVCVAREFCDKKVFALIIRCFGLHPYVNNGSVLVPFDETEIAEKINKILDFELTGSLLSKNFIENFDSSGKSIFGTCFSGLTSSRM